LVTPRLALLMFATLPSFAQDHSASLVGRIEDSSGAGLSGAYLTVDSTSGRFHQLSRAGVDGTFRFSGLPLGTYLLRSSPLGFASVKATLSLRAGEQRSLPDLTLVSVAANDCPPAIDPKRTGFLAKGSPEALAGTVHGTVQRGSAPAVGVGATICQLVCRDLIAARSDSQGNFHFEKLVPGIYSLDLGQGPKGMRINVTGGLESWYSFNLAPAPANSARPKSNVCK
jgi:Carboxypeptidase regulatory-like domain